MRSFTALWDAWDMHPKGEELVVCIEGSVTLHQEVDAKTRTVELGVGQAIINPPGVLHTADVTDKATALFITAGIGTEIRPR